MTQDLKTKIAEAENPFGHRWDECGLCGPMVTCGKCGNNCCNGGYGTFEGATCDACPSAYDMQDQAQPKTEEG